MYFPDALMIYLGGGCVWAVLTLMNAPSNARFTLAPHLCVIIDEHFQC